MRCLHNPNGQSGTFQDAKQNYMFTVQISLRGSDGQESTSEPKANESNFPRTTNGEQNCAFFFFHRLFVLQWVYAHMHESLMRHLIFCTRQWIVLCFLQTLFELHASDFSDFSAKASTFLLFFSAQQLRSMMTENSKSSTMVRMLAPKVRPRTPPISPDPETEDRTALDENWSKPCVHRQTSEIEQILTDTQHAP